MNDDFNEQSTTRVRLKSNTAFKWQKAGTNGHYTDIPGCTGHQIWCMLHPRKPNVAGWQICDATGNMIFVEGCIEVTDVLDMRQQAENIALLWISGSKKAAV